MKRTQTLVTCDHCGSVYFHEAEFKEYRGEMYSSGVGGAICQLSDLPQRIRVCVCGEPVPDPSIRRAGPDARNFTQCVAQAKAHRARQRPAALLQELLGELAGKTELAATQERLANLEQALKVITAEMESSEKRPVDAGPNLCAGPLPEARKAKPTSPTPPRKARERR